MEEVALSHLLLIAAVFIPTLPFQATQDIVRELWGADDAISCVVAVVFVRFARVTLVCTQAEGDFSPSGTFVVFFTIFITIVIETISHAYIAFLVRVLHREFSRELS